jgi:2-hydroxychromene-2-carboxylate isomerase
MPKLKQKTKIKRQFKKAPARFILQSVMILIGLNFMACGMVWVWQMTQIVPPALAEVNFNAADKISVTDKEYVLNEVRKAGLSPEEADCIITHESGWRKDAWNANSNDTVDLGLWQINSVHFKKISPADTFDVVKATRFAIEKRLHDRNWNAWVGWRACR